MVAMDVLAGLEELGFTEVPDVLASPLSGPSSPDPSEDGRRGGGGGRGSSSSSAPEGCSVYVSNLAYAVSRAALARLFGSCGDVRRVSIPLDPVGRPQGHAYIEFASPHQAQAALNVAGAEMGGRPLRVSLKRSGSPTGGKSPSPSPAAAGGSHAAALDAASPQHLQHQQHRASEPGHSRHPGSAYGGGGGSTGGRQGRSQNGGGGGSGRRAGGDRGRARVVSDDTGYYPSPAAPAPHPQPAPRHVHPFSKTGIPHSGSQHGLFPAPVQHAAHGGAYSGHMGSHGDQHQHHHPHANGHAVQQQHYNGGYSAHHHLPHAGYRAEGGYGDYHPGPHQGRHQHHAAHPSMYWME